MVIFGASDPAIWGPWRTAGEVVPRPPACQRGDQVLDALHRRAGARMKQILRLLSYGRKFWPQLLLSVVLMALAGAAQGTMPLLIQPIFDRVLVANAPGGPIPLLPPPLLRPPDSTCTTSCRFTDAAIGSWSRPRCCIAFLLKGALRLLRQLSGQLRRLRRVTDLRNAVFDKVLKQGAQFFEAHSTGQLMSSIMNDVDKVQVATSQILADFLRQFFSAAFLLFVVLSNDWQLALVSLIVLPAVMLPTMRIGRRIRRTSRRTQERQAELNQILQETLSGHMVVKAFGAEAYESRRFHAASHRLLQDQRALRAAAGALLAADRFLRRAHHRRPADLRAHPDQGRRASPPATFTSFVIALLHAARAGQAPGRHLQHLSAGARRVAEGLRVSGPSRRVVEPRAPPSSPRFENAHRLRERRASTIPARPTASACRASIWK